MDRHFNETGELKGPLHGIPVTLKDQFNVKGYDSTLGYVGRAFKPASEDAVLVQMLKSMGAIILAKTNLPQSIMVYYYPLHLAFCTGTDSFVQWCETENPLFGLTVNPRNKDLTPGGSTGGESVMLALHGSILGFGTDIGGSIRIPQHLMGLYGLKPSVCLVLLFADLSACSRFSRALAIPITERPFQPRDKSMFPRPLALWHEISLR